MGKRCERSDGGMVRQNGETVAALSLALAFALLGHE